MAESLLSNSQILKIIIFLCAKDKWFVKPQGFLI